MSAIRRNPAVLVWAVLMAFTLGSWLLGSGTGDPVEITEAAGGLVLAVAFVKTWLVGQWFMELRGAPALLRGLFDAWVVVIGTAVVALYVLG